MFKNSGKSRTAAHWYAVRARPAHACRQALSAKLDLLKIPLRECGDFIRVMQHNYLVSYRTNSFVDSLISNLFEIMSIINFQDTYYRYFIVFYL